MTHVATHGNAPFKQHLRGGGWEHRVHAMKSPPQPLPPAGGQAPQHQRASRHAVRSDERAPRTEGQHAHRLQVPPFAAANTTPCHFCRVVGRNQCSVISRFTHSQLESAFEQHIWRIARESILKAQMGELRGPSPMPYMRTSVTTEHFRLLDGDRNLHRA